MVTEEFEPQNYSTDICLEANYLQETRNLKIFLVSEINSTSNNNMKVINSS